MNAISLDQRGGQLRIEIERIYHQLKREKKLVSGPKGNDIGEIVREYVRIGDSFDDAETILRSAGFTVHPRPGLDATGNRPDKYHVVAFINSLDHEGGHHIQVIVSLGPKTPNDYSSIYQISAGIFSASP